MREIIGAGGQVSLIRHDSIEFFDCGENFSEITCPQCGVEIDQAVWGDMMDRDYVPTRMADPVNGIAPGFRMQADALPCCGASATVAQLDYVWPVAFGRFAVEAANPAIGELTTEQVMALEAALGCPLIVVYRHL
ncbi:hypothetical protein JJJ17_09870 [Paracoccus caeni]|uniref:Uncharacterized protein n=1 Tax=Paracoccus caeni TaxID=657651 RepID=A0A934SCC0_9RHOB|nr:hypothetical protein [Paracoccus caeni]MBK4216231.1 hypothetical protein [Paracoccus caeni]